MWSIGEEEDRHALVDCLVPGPLAWTSQARGELILNVTLDYDQERDHVATQATFATSPAFSARLGQSVKLIMTQNAERVGEHIRTGTYSMLLAPAQLVGTGHAQRLHAGGQDRAGHPGRCWWPARIPDSLPGRRAASASFCPIRNPW
jgi:hypothetical protein